jgi:hypothetical protein
MAVVAVGLIGFLELLTAPSARAPLKTATALPALETGPSPLAAAASNPAEQTIEPEERLSRLEPPPIQIGLSPQDSLEAAPPRDSAPLVDLQSSPSEPAPPPVAAVPSARIGAAHQLGAPRKPGDWLRPINRDLRHLSAHRVSAGWYASGSPFGTWQSDRRPPFRRRAGSRRDAAGRLSTHAARIDLSRGSGFAPEPGWDRLYLQSRRVACASLHAGAERRFQRLRVIQELRRLPPRVPEWRGQTPRGCRTMERRSSPVRSVRKPEADGESVTESRRAEAKFRRCAAWKSRPRSPPLRGATSRTRGAS